MSDATVQPPAPSADKMQWAEQVVGDILRLMEVPARLELKDAAPTPMDKGVPGISVAVHLETELPGVAAGRRSGLSDSLQFLANKIINRAGTDKRWIQVGIGGHPEPRPAAAPPSPGPTKKEKAPDAAVAAPAAASSASPSGKPSQRSAAARSAATDEATLEVPPDAAVSALGGELAQKSAQHGRLYAVVGLTQADRARMLQAARSVSGVTAKVEGEGRARRLAFLPDKPVPMPKNQYPDDDADEGED